LRFACRHLSISFPGRSGRSQALSKIQALSDVSIEARRGEFVSVVGPSGCGKTTLLRTIAGFLKPDAGSIELDIPSHSGQCLMVYQENSLFPWKTVLDNACFGLEMQGVPPEERCRLAAPYFRRLHLEGREHAWPHQLSAGMKQRVAVIRSFLSNPDLLLMDEPFAALDCQLRLCLQQDLMELWERDHKTVLFVTHDIEEAILLGDRVVVMSATPGTVVAEFAVGFDRPRDAALTLTEEFLHLKRQIAGHLNLPRTESRYVS
jgi:NitT/TauT family transport system ATP-binding protein